MPIQLRVVLDTNVLLRGLLNGSSASGHVVDACDRRAIILLLSKPVISEYRATLRAAEIVKRYPELTATKVELAIRRLQYVAEIDRDLRVSFSYPRDPKDARFLELAIAGKASHLITADKDLLSLSPGHDDAARRFRQRAPFVRIMQPRDFLNAAEI